jgi:enoyl-CoA hydratase
MEPNRLLRLFIHQARQLDPVRLSKRLPNKLVSGFPQQEGPGSINRLKPGGTMRSDNRILVYKDGRIARVILDRPQAMNALDRAMLRNMSQVFAELERDGNLRAVILSGNKHFCAGADLKELKDMGPNAAEAFAKLGHSVLNQIENFPLPVIAALSGYALGGGCELALACDIRIAGISAMFGQPEVSIGLIPGFGGTQRLTRLVGLAKAKELILSGRIIDGREAESSCLVNRAVPDSVLQEEAQNLARVIAEKSPVAVRLAKEILNRGFEIDSGFPIDVGGFAGCFTSADRIEGINAFLEKRKPVFGKD